MASSPITSPSIGPSIVIFSGGSASNSLVDVFGALSAATDLPLIYLISISDNGGSTSELLRMFGGPGIGDIRSRLVRLIPTSNATPQAVGMRYLLNLRLDEEDPKKARDQFASLCEGSHPAWAAIPADKRAFLRAIFSHLQMEVFKRTRYPHTIFDFRNASVGNLFLTGTRLFTGSFDSAIWLFRACCGLGEGRDSAMVWPIVESSWTHHIAAALEDGTTIVGQNQISHPSAETPAISELERGVAGLAVAEDVVTDDEVDDFFGEDEEPESDTHFPGTLPSLSKSHIHFSKAEDTPLPSRINRLWYISSLGLEVRPKASPNASAAIRDAKVIVYSIGSLWTSLIPCLLPHPVPEILASANYGQKKKVFLLNNTIDREVSGGAPYTAADFLESTARSIWYYASRPRTRSRAPSPTYTPASSVSSVVSTALNGQTAVKPVFRPEVEISKVVTHLVYLVGKGTPEVDVKKISEWGVTCIQVSGRWEKGVGLVYEESEMGQVLEGIVKGKI